MCSSRQASLSRDSTLDPTSGPPLNPTPNPVHYLARSGEMLLASEAIEAEAFRAKLDSENGERYALQFRQAMQDLRRDFVPTPASAPGPNYQAFTLGYVPRAELTSTKSFGKKRLVARCLGFSPPKSLPISI
jgi:hypothetical protein